MSFACPGLTHCISCGQTLDMSENVLCKSCEKAKEQRQFISYGEWLKNPKNWEPSHNHHRLEPIKLFIASKPENCKYCQEEKPLYYQLGLGVSFSTEIKIEDNILKIVEINTGHNAWNEGKRETILSKINYCPMCGRKLV